jgi:hypothetical protein
MEGVVIVLQKLWFPCNEFYLYWCWQTFSISKLFWKLDAVIGDSSEARVQLSQISLDATKEDKNDQYKSRMKENKL